MEQGSKGWQALTQSIRIMLIKIGLSKSNSRVKPKTKTPTSKLKMYATFKIVVWISVDPVWKIKFQTLCKTHIIQLKVTKNFVIAVIPS